MPTADRLFPAYCDGGGGDNGNYEAWLGICAGSNTSSVTTLAHVSGHVNPDHTEEDTADPSVTSTAATGRNAADTLCVRTKVGNGDTGWVLDPLGALGCSALAASTVTFQTVHGAGDDDGSWSWWDDGNGTVTVTGISYTGGTSAVGLSASAAGLSTATASLTHTTLGPAILAVSAVDGTHVDVTLSQEPTDSSSQDVANWSVNKSVTVSAAVKQSNPAIVRLTVSQMGYNRAYIVTGSSSIVGLSAHAMGAYNSLAFTYAGPLPDKTIPYPDDMFVVQGEEMVPNRIDAWHQLCGPPAVVGSHLLYDSLNDIYSLAAMSTLAALDDRADFRIEATLACPKYTGDVGGYLYFSEGAYFRIDFYGTRGQPAEGVQNMWNTYNRNRNSTGYKTVGADGKIDVAWEWDASERTIARYAKHTDEQSWTHLVEPQAMPWDVLPVPADQPAPLFALFDWGGAGADWRTNGSLIEWYSLKVITGSLTTLSFNPSRDGGNDARLFITTDANVVTYQTADRTGGWAPSGSTSTVVLGPWTPISLIEGATCWVSKGTGHTATALWRDTSASTSTPVALVLGNNSVNLPAFTGYVRLEITLGNGTTAAGTRWPLLRSITLETSASTEGSFATPLDATAHGAATASATVGAVYALAASSAASSAVTASLGTVDALDATAAGLGLSTATLTALIGLAAGSVAGSLATAAVGGYVPTTPLEASAQGASSVSAQLDAVLALAGVAIGSATATAALAQLEALDATAQGHAAVTGVLGVLELLAAQAAGHATVGAALEVIASMDAAALGSGDVSGVLATILALTGSVTGTATATAAMEGSLAAQGLDAASVGGASAVAQLALLTALGEAVSAGMGDAHSAFRALVGLVGMAAGRGQAVAAMSEAAADTYRRYTHLVVDLPGDVHLTMEHVGDTYLITGGE